MEIAVVDTISLVFTMSLLFPQNPLFSVNIFGVGSFLVDTFR
jgi:hypothetical protein